MNLFNLAGTLSQLYITMRKDAELQAWLRLFVSLVVSGVVSFSGMTGLALMAGKGGADAIGVGLFSLAAAWFGVCSISPQGRYLIQSLPKGFVEQIQEHPDQVTVIGTDAEKK